MSESGDQLAPHPKPCHWPVYHCCLCGPSEPQELAEDVSVVRAVRANVRGRIVAQGEPQPRGGQPLYQVAWDNGQLTWHSFIDLRVNTQGPST